jgi:hypothetical protein
MTQLLYFSDLSVYGNATEWNLWIRNVYQHRALDRIITLLMGDIC